jgi:putative hydrolase of the HAD superfamily
MPLNLVAFDLDDTLYLERYFVKSGLRAVAHYLEKNGIIAAENFFPTAWDLFEQGHRGTIFNQTFESLGVVIFPEQISQLVSVYREHQPDIYPHTPALQLLQTLREQGVVLGLISDGPLLMQQNKLKALKLENYFTHIIFTGAYGLDWAKPSTLAFQELMNRAKMRGNNCQYIADNPKKDFLGPNNLGWRTIRIRHPAGIYYHESPPPGGEPHETIERFADLAKLILS